VRFARLAATRQTFLHPIFDTILRFLDVTPLGSLADDGFECHSGLDLKVRVGVKEGSIFAVVDDQTVLAVIERESL